MLERKSKSKSLAGFIALLWVLPEYTKHVQLPWYNGLKKCFHFQNGFRNELSFSKCGIFSKWVLFSNVKIFWVFSFFFWKTQLLTKICKQKSVQSVQIALPIRYCKKTNEIYDNIYKNEFQIPNLFLRVGRYW